MLTFLSVMGSLKEACQLSVRTEATALEMLTPERRGRLFFFFFFMFIIFERDRQRASWEGAEREGDTESEAGSRL